MLTDDGKVNNRVSHRRVPTEWPPSGDDLFRSVLELYLLFLFFSQQTDQHFMLSFVRVSREQVTETRDVFVANELLHFRTTCLFRFIHLEFPIG